jgi:hypothetical protein
VFRKRFRQLEMDPTAAEAEASPAASEPSVATPVFRRRLEMKGERATPPITPSATDVCRRCGAEHPESQSHCTRCGGALGGPGQNAFDLAYHARRNAHEDEAIAARVGISRNPPEAEPAAESAEPGFGTVLAAGALTACIFALVSVPVRLAFSAAFQDHMPWRAVPELLIVAVLTLVVRRSFARSLRRL